MSKTIREQVKEYWDGYEEITLDEYIKARDTATQNSDAKLYFLMNYNCFFDVDSGEVRYLRFKQKRVLRGGEGE